MLLLLPLLLAGTGFDDVRAELERLEASAADERNAAESWLASHLLPDDFPLVAEAAKERGLETRTRLARALGSDERNFELSLLLFGDPEPELSAIGSEAVGAMAERWFGDFELAPRSDLEVVTAIVGYPFGSFALRLHTDDPDSVLDRLARWAPELATRRAPRARLAIATDPSLFADFATGRAGRTRGRAPDWVEGSFEEVLLLAVRRQALGFEGFGLDGPHPWVRVAPAGDLGGKRGLELLLGWCRAVMQYPDRPRGEGAARALAACGWPAPVAWLESRWNKLEDRNALSGLLLAAGRGRVAPSLATTASVERLVGELVREGLSTDVERAERLMRALAHLPRWGADGSDLGAAVLRASRWRFGSEELVFAAGVLGGMGVAPEDFRDAVRTRLASAVDPAAPLRERIELARMLALTETRALAPWRVEFDGELLGVLVADRAGPQFVAWMRALNARPAERGRTRETALALDDGSLLLGIEWWLTCGDEGEVAAQWIDAWLTAGRPQVALGDRLAERARWGDAPAVQRALARLSATRSDDALARVVWLSGAASTEQIAAAVARWGAAGPIPFDDWPIVGEVAGAAGGEPLAEVLIDHAQRVVSVERSLDAPWVDAYRRALARLAGRDGSDAQVLRRRMLRELSSALRKSAEEGRGRAHPLWEAVRNGRWPPEGGPTPVSLEALEPHL